MTCQKYMFSTTPYIETKNSNKFKWPNGWKKNRQVPVDNRPSTDLLHQFVERKNVILFILLSDTWHVTHDTCTWRVTRDIWHLICDICWEVNNLSKFQLPTGLGDTVLWKYYHKGPLGLLITKAFVEQPRLHPFCKLAGVA